MTTPSTPTSTPTSRRGHRTRRASAGWRAAGVGLVATALSLTSLGAGAAALPTGGRTLTASVASPTAGVSLADWQDSYGYGSLPGTTDPYGDSSSTASDVDSTTASAKQSAGVVLVDTVLGYADGAGAGTGIVLTADGQVLTNYHVVEGATSIEVTIASTGRTYTADVVGHSTTGDVALLQLEHASGLTTATIDDDSVATGDEVTAVGNAGGTGTLTAAAGTVSSLGETITTAEESGVEGETLHGLIETSSDVVPGDSGGPLYDAEGEVVGIDTAASSGTDIDGYAIPIAKALAVATQIRSGEETSTVQIGAAAFLGVQVASTSAAASSGSGYPGQDAAYGSTSGAAVVGVVDGSPAATAGLGAGDTVTAVDGHAVTGTTTVASLLADHDAGDRVQVAWTDSAGSGHTATVTLTESPVA